MTDSLTRFRVKCEETRLGQTLLLHPKDEEKHQNKMMNLHFES